MSRGQTAYDLHDLLRADGRQALEHLRLKARKLVTGMLHGAHRSRRKGVSTEFDHHAIYQPGDPLKLIDWKASARHDRVYVKRQLEDTALQVRIVVDRSGSMRRATGAGPTKYLQAARLATALAYVILEERDRFGLSIAGGTAAGRQERGGDAWLPAGSGETHLVRCVQALCAAEGSGGDDLAECLRVQVERSERRGLTALVSDLMFDPLPVQAQLARLKAQGQDLVVFQICDPVEEDFPFNRWIRFQSLEAAGRGTRIDTVPLKRIYREEFAAVQEEWRQWCRRNDAHFVTARADAAMEAALAEYLAFRDEIGR
jgi:uncharacterized protein (DUF58 family)